MKKIIALVLILSPLLSFGQEVAMLPSEGFTLSSLGRGVIGMVTLLVVAFLFSGNKKNIDWKTVGLGLVVFLQLTSIITTENVITRINKWNKEKKLRFDNLPEEHMNSVST